MKTGSFGLFGGYPLTQNRLKDMQEGYMEAFAGVLSMLGDGSTPVILSGMVESILHIGSSYFHVLTEGYFYYCVPGGTPQVYHSPADAAVTTNGTFVTYLDITNVITDAYYNSGALAAVVNDSYGTVSVSASGAGTGTHLEFSTMIPFATALGNNCRDATWTNLPVAFSGAGTRADVNGTISYLVDRASNYVHVTGQLNVTNVFNLTGGGYHSDLTDPIALPVPANPVYLTAFNADQLMKDVTNTFYIAQSLLSISPTGAVNLFLYESYVDTNFSVKITGGYFLG